MNIKQQLLEYCKEPQTVEDVAAKFQAFREGGYLYSVIYRAIKRGELLVLEGKLWAA